MPGPGPRYAVRVAFGKDPTSGLWEFLVHGTGAPVLLHDDARGAAGPGRLLPDGGSAMILVLLPGATFDMGADHAHDVGNAAAFLLSDLAGGISAEIVYVDGGFSQVGIGSLDS